MPNKTGIDAHTTQRMGVTLSSVTNASAVVSGNLDEARLTELINAVRAVGGSVKLVSGALTINY